VPFEARRHGLRRREHVRGVATPDGLARIERQVVAERDERILQGRTRARMNVDVARRHRRHPEPLRELGERAIARPIVALERPLQLHPQAPVDLLHLRLQQVAPPRAEEVLMHVADEIRDSGWERQLSSGVVLTGGGAFLNGVRLKVSGKTSLDGALTGTGQAQAGQDAELLARMGASFTAMSEAALYVRISVPVTHQLAQVAAGRMDLHWQFDNVRSHAAGVLLVQEAGGVVTDLDGGPWDLTSRAYLAAAPGVHAAALKDLTA